MLWLLKICPPPWQRLYLVGFIIFDFLDAHFPCEQSEFLLPARLFSLSGRWIGQLIGIEMLNILMSPTLLFPVLIFPKLFLTFIPNGQFGLILGRCLIGSHSKLIILTSITQPRFLSFTLTVCSPAASPEHKKNLSWLLLGQISWKNRNNPVTGVPLLLTPTDKMIISG